MVGSIESVREKEAMKVQPSAVLVLLVLQIQQVFLRNPGYIKREALVDVMRGAPESIDIRIINYSNTTLLNPVRNFHAFTTSKQPYCSISNATSNSTY